MSNGFRPGSPGSVVHADSGKMVWFNVHQVDVFSGKEVRCWRRSKAIPEWRGYVPTKFPNPWLNHLPGEEPPLENVSRRQALARQWLERLVGLEIRAALFGVPDELTWGALMIMTRVPHGVQLFRDHPLWCLWGYYHGYGPGTRRLGLPFSRLRTLLGQPRTRLLAAMGLLPEPRIARILDKVDLHGLSPGILPLCRVIFQSDNRMLRHLQHVPRISSEVLRLCARQASLDLLHEPGGVSGSLIWELSRKGIARRREILNAHQEALHLKMELRPFQKILAEYSAGDRALIRIPELQCSRRVILWRNELRALRRIFSDGLLELNSELEIPPAPFPGMQVNTPSGWVRIAPLQTVQAHFELAERMQNCLAGEVANVMAGKSFLFHVAGEFCDDHCLETKWDGQDWALRLCRGPRNRMPHPLVVEAIRLWAEEMMVYMGRVWLRDQDETEDGIEVVQENEEGGELPF
ncbi:MAG: hypothetical protein LAT83_22385 [Kiritimatiellae bacterium]|nr:hypothetical protein [Kiritimatiellia bacterium]